MYYDYDSASNGIFALILPLVTFLVLISVVAFIIVRRIQKRRQRAKMLEETYSSIPTQVLETDKQRDPGVAV